eukprot:TRINITY_DN13087_c0_g1_i2.p1 TRINITY_DN13087_c0_g1~~TRINITY_DN13087_c0_g1_i2.p1  ORF type:complete len:227 (-),score=43.73 TRINITY_DN13087_c0_g1_i2:36-668(-)
MCIRDRFFAEGSQSNFQGSRSVDRQEMLSRYSRENWVRFSKNFSSSPEQSSRGGSTRRGEGFARPEEGRDDVYVRGLERALATQQKENEMLRERNSNLLSEVGFQKALIQDQSRLIAELEQQLRAAQRSRQSENKSYQTPTKKPASQQNDELPQSSEQGSKKKRTSPLLNKRIATKSPILDRAERLLSPFRRDERLTDRSNEIPLTPPPT